MRYRNPSSYPNELPTTDFDHAIQLYEPPLIRWFFPYRRKLAAKLVLTPEKLIHHKPGLLYDETESYSIADITTVTVNEHFGYSTVSIEGHMINETFKVHKSHTKYLSNIQN